jgi:hypothetical protein
MDDLRLRHDYEFDPRNAKRIKKMSHLNFNTHPENTPTAALVAAVVERRDDKAAVSQRRADKPVDAASGEDIYLRATANLIGVLESRSTRSFEDRILSAMVVRELRERVEAGQMGDVTWYSWARANIKLGATRLKEHMRIAHASNPRAEIRRLIKLSEARAQRLDENKARRDAAEWERKAVATFAWHGPIEQVRMLYQLKAKMPKLH